MKNLEYFRLKKRLYWFTVLKKECQLSFWTDYKLEYIRIHYGILSDEFYFYLKKLLIQFNLKNLENFDEDWEPDLMDKYLKNKQQYNY